MPILRFWPNLWHVRKSLSPFHSAIIWIATLIKNMVIRFPLPYQVGLYNPQLRFWIFNRLNRMRKLLFSLFGPSAKFEIGDSVELLEGGQLMVVTKISKEPGAEYPCIHCQWTDSGTNEIRTKIFSERELQIIDWYRVKWLYYLLRHSSETYIECWRL